MGGVSTTDIPPTTKIKPRPAADVFMRRLLRIPDVPTKRPLDAHRVFSVSILVSATRCLLTYVLLPFLVPLIGWAAGVGPWIGIPLSMVAVTFDVISIRRFWLLDHKWRWGYTLIASSVIVLVLILLVQDVATLMG
jgi:hypothetical protein